MEEITKIIDELKQNKIEKNDTSNIKNWKKPIKFKKTCIVCGKEFEFEATPKHQLEAMQWEKGWDSPKKSFCSEKCKEVNINKRKLSEYKEWLRIMPFRFRDIECDRKDLVEQGMNQSLFITGATGVGKTVLMAGVAKRIIKNEEI